MARPYSSGGLACSSQVFTANTAGTLIGVCGGANASAQGVTPIEGIVRSVCIGVDSSQTTVSIYDGNSTAGRLVWRVLSANPPATIASVSLDVQLQNGLFVVISGGTAPNITVIYA